MPMKRWILTLDITQLSVLLPVWGGTVALLIVLVVLTARRAPEGGFRRILLGTLPAGIAGLILGWALSAFHVFGPTLPTLVMFWVGACFAALGLVAINLWKSPALHKVIAIVTAVFVILSTFLGINLAFDMDRSLSDLLGLATLPAAGAFPAPPSDEKAPNAPLYSSWNPPADMPTQGKALQLVGDQAIRSSAGFSPRYASIYMPPAALVDDAPALPVMVLMMGLPGSPNAQVAQKVGDAFAAEHNGLAPIIIVADQLGGQYTNPGCVDSHAYGGVNTYFNVDIPAYIRSHLRVIDDPAYWSIVGYSNGGACSFLFGAQHPKIWGSFVSISGEEWPGYETPGPILKKVYNGDKAAFDANKPETVMGNNHGKYANNLAIITVGASDSRYLHVARSVAAATTQAGFTTTFYEVPGAGHTGSALPGGLTKALNVLAPVWGLTPR